MGNLDVNNRTPRPVVKLADHTQAGKATIDAEQQRLAGGPDKAVTEEAYVKDRLEREGANLSPEERQGLEARLHEEFKKYDGDANGLDEHEFLSLMQDRAQTGGNTQLGAGNLSEADAAALNDGITERGDAVKQRQHELNEQIKAGKIPGPPLAEDGKEGPKTRAAMLAAANYQRADAAVIAGAAPTDPAAKDTAYDQDAKTLADANAAYEATPEGPAKEALGQKVQALAKAFDQKWGAYQQERQAVDAINGLVATPPQPGELVGPDGKLREGAQEILDHQQATLDQARAELAKLPDGPRKQELAAKIDQYEQAVVASQRPAGAPPETPVEAVAREKQALEAKLSAKAGHPVTISFGDDAMTPEQQRAQLANVRKMADDPANDGKWGQFEHIQFNTWGSYRDSGDPNNPSHYAEVDGKTLNLNNAANDGLTDVEADKQRRAVGALANG